MNILQVRKYCLQINQIREKNKLHIPLQEKLLTTKKKTIEDQGEKQIKAIEENKKNKQIIKNNNQANINKLLTEKRMLLNLQMTKVQ